MEKEISITNKKLEELNALEVEFYDAIIDAMVRQEVVDDFTLLYAANLAFKRFNECIYEHAEKMGIEREQLEFVVKMSSLL